MGPVTLRTALAHSLNVATVKVAAEGRATTKWCDMAHRVGLNEAIKATPAVALGAYETTPLEIAGAYTVFANEGAHVTPTTISLVRAPDGSVLYQTPGRPRNTLDPRVTYLMVNMMQDVLRTGTGAGVHARGFNLPAAGKTGTSHDGWFAGFTSNLLCVVWVGFDDNRELNLEGAHSALPIWAEFMKQATKFHRYEDVRNFQAPRGVISVRICADSGQLAGPVLPERSVRRVHRWHGALDRVPVAFAAAQPVCRPGRGYGRAAASHAQPVPSATPLVPNVPSSLANQPPRKR